MNKGFETTLEYSGTLDATLIRADGSHRDLGQLSGPKNHRLIGRPIQWWRALWSSLKGTGVIPVAMGFAAFLSTYAVVDQVHKMHDLLKDQRVVDLIMGTGNFTTGLVVTGGMNYLATDFAAGLSSPRISAMNYHDSGTGTVAATSTDSGLGTQAGPATRATGTQSNPATNQYRSVGTINYTSTLAITEWGLFSASTSGTMWDRRVFSAVNVVNGDSLQITYTLTLTAGGS